jgi:phosphatidyl-myo-inositol dimannoside synthase
MNNKPAIVVSTQCFPPDSGGIETLMYSLSASLSIAGYDVTVYADHATRKTGTFDKNQTFKIKRFSGIKPWRRRKKAHDICRLAQSYGSDKSVLITDSWKSLELVNTEHFARVLCLVHGTEIPLVPARSKQERIGKAFAKADYIVANSAYTAQRISPYVGQKQNVRVILPGIAEPVTDDLVNTGIRQRLAGYGPVLITLARLEERKGQMDVIRILPDLVAEFPDLLYIVAGEGSYKNALAQETARLGMQDHVLFTGTVGDPEKSAWLRNSTLFVMPGKVVGDDVEGFGMAYIEAALHGVPAVASSAGGAPEAVLHESTGLVVPPDDREKLLHAIEMLLRNNEYRQQLGKNARLRANNFLWRNKHTEFLQLMEQHSTED